MDTSECLARAHRALLASESRICAMRSAEIDLHQRVARSKTLIRDARRAIDANPLTFALELAAPSKPVA